MLRVIKVIVGLGNPGLKYEKTRHNAGFLFVDHLSILAASRWVGNSQFHGDVSECDFVGSKLYLLKPMTFMNRSGSSVGAFLRYYKFLPEEMLVVHDDLELSEGVVRLKRDGGHGGHNGLRDIIANIGSRDFYRLRIGIGRPEAGANVADYVLSAIPASDRVGLANVFDKVLSEMNLLVNVESSNLSRFLFRVEK